MNTEHVFKENAVSVGFGFQFTKPVGSAEFAR